MAFGDFRLSRKIARRRKLYLILSQRCLIGGSISTMACRGESIVLKSQAAAVGICDDIRGVREAARDEPLSTTAITSVAPGDRLHPFHVAVIY